MPSHCYRWISHWTLIILWEEIFRKRFDQPTKQNYTRTEVVSYLRRDQEFSKWSRLPGRPVIKTLSFHYRGHGFRELGFNIPSKDPPLPLPKQTNKQKFNSLEFSKWGKRVIELKWFTWDHIALKKSGPKHIYCFPFLQGLGHLFIKFSQKQINKLLPNL